MRAVFQSHSRRGGWAVLQPLTRPTGGFRRGAHRRHRLISVVFRHQTLRLFLGKARRAGLFLGKARHGLSGLLPLTHAGDTELLFGRAASESGADVIRPLFLSASLSHDPQRACSRSTRLRILPVALLGNSSTMTTDSGILYVARCSRAYAMTASGSTAPGAVGVI